MKKYIGKRMQAGPCRVSVVTPAADGERTYPLKHVLRHSPDGFQWGYGGSGPSDLALSILTDLVGREKAERWYQPFKWEFIAPTQGDLEVDGEKVLEWLEEQEAEVFQ